MSTIERVWTFFLVAVLNVNRLDAFTDFLLSRARASRQWSIERAQIGAPLVIGGDPAVLGSPKPL
jgi:hypothetical protein